MDRNKQLFFELIRAGLFPSNYARILVHEASVDWNEVFRLAEEQSVVGLVAAGINTLPLSDRPPQKVVLQFVWHTLHLEQRNKALNEFIAVLTNRLRQEDIYAILVKGQGIARCYEMPLWRACGDVDLLLSDSNYEKAKKLLLPLASDVKQENTYYKHLGMTIDGWVVELHGTLRSGLGRSIDSGLEKVQETVFCEGKVRTWTNGDTQVFLPSPDEDVVFVFAHILQHFYKEGIGLRQICDWCRLLYTYRYSLNYMLLESRIKSMGVMTEWRAFYNLACRYLGMPDLDSGLTDIESATPQHSSIKLGSAHGSTAGLMSQDSKFDKKADKIMAFVLETGNFGHNRDYSYRKKYPYLVFKAISLWKHIKDFGRYFVIFPLDAIKVTWRRICMGIVVAIKESTGKLGSP